MRVEYEQALRFAQKIDAFRSRGELLDAARGVVEPFGARYVGVASVFSANKGPRSRFIAGLVDQTWTARYLRERMQLNDPVVDMVATSPRPFSWCEAQKAGAPKGSGVLDACREHTGSGEGFTVPFRNAQGDLLITTVHGERLDLSPETRPVIALVSYYFGMRVCELTGADARAAKPANLSPRQGECLQWVAEGKTDEEIGKILGLSHNTVHRHVEAAKAQLGVCTRAQAVISAFKLGLLD